jgi:serine/threonine protein kinase
MESLFETITKCKCQSIPSHYSKELSSVIKLMLQQNPIHRPSTDKLLKSSLFNKKAMELKI